MSASRFLFGPVPSRRLGLSLGIDLVPGNCCSLDCIYCESGKTACLTTKRQIFVSTDLIRRELEAFLSEIRGKGTREPDYLTFSGSSEPTLASNLGEVISVIRDLGFSSKIAVLTNSTLLDQKEVRQDLLKADLILPSFDAALPESFLQINRPAPGISVESLLQGLKALRKEFSGLIFLEIFIVPQINTSLEELKAFRQAIEEIAPDRVQLNSLDRPGTLKGLVKAPESLLKEILRFWNLPQVEIIASYTSKEKPGEDSGFVIQEEGVLETLRRRPCTFVDLQEAFSSSERLTEALDALSRKGKIVLETGPRGIFYRLP